MDGKFVIEQFNYYVTTGSFFSVMSLINIVLMYLIIATMGDTGSVKGAMPSWWKWSRVPMVISAIFVIWSCADVSNGFRFLLVLLMPNFYLMENSCENAVSLAGIGFLSFSKGNTWGWTTNIYSFINGSIVMVVLFMSMGSRARLKCIYAYPYISLTMTDGAEMVRAQPVVPT